MLGYLLNKLIPSDKLPFLKKARISNNSLFPRKDFSKNHQTIQQLSAISNADFRLTGNQKDPQERLNTSKNKKKAVNHN